MTKKSGRAEVMKGSVKFDDVLKEKLKDSAFARDYRKELLSAEVAEQLAALRARKNVTQKELGDRTGLKQANVARLEAGRLNLTLDTIQRVAGALGYTVAVSFKPARA